MSSGTHHPGVEVGDAIALAMSQIIPERCSPQTYKFGSPRQMYGDRDPRTGQPFFDHGGEVSAGWVNAVDGVDGWGAMVPAMGNLIKAEAEFNEGLFPHILRSRNLITDSGGPGKFRGGCGSHFVKEVRTPTYVNQYVVNQRHIHPGIAGGLHGSPDICTVSAGTEREVVVSPAVQGHHPEGIGSSKAETFVDAAIDLWVWYAGWADKIAQVRGSTNPVAGPYFNFSLPEPTGVVAVLAPQRGPLLGFISVVAPAIVTGNTVVVLAPEQYPLPAVTLSEVLATSDVPGGRGQRANRTGGGDRAVARVPHGRQRHRPDRRARRPAGRPGGRRRRQPQVGRCALGEHRLGGDARPGPHAHVSGDQDRMAPRRDVSGACC